MNLLKNSPFLLMTVASVFSIACTDVGDTSPPGDQGSVDAGGALDVTAAGDVETSPSATDATAEAAGDESNPGSPTGDAGADDDEPPIDTGTQPPPAPDTGADSSSRDGGATDAGGADASIEDATNPDAGGPDAEGVDAGAPDTGTDSGAPDAGAPDTGTDSGGGLTACTKAPCASGGANSVQCFDSPTSDGVCTPTEALIVARDIAKGNLDSSGQLKPFVNNSTTVDNQGSCYTCLNTKSCLDDDQQDVGNECADSPDLAGAAAGSGASQCVATLSCILSSDCQGPGGIAGTSAVAAQENVQLCYCGGNNAGSVCSTAGTGTNGLCVTDEAAGFGFPFSDNKDILANYGNQLLPSGIANAIFQCATSQKCAICQ